MNRRTARLEAAAMMTRLVDRAWRAHSPGAVPPSAFTIATTLDKLHRACVKVKRLHEDECNGDHERCARCGGDGKLGRAFGYREPVLCTACGGTGRLSEDEVKAWLLARDKAERRIEKLLRDLGFHPPSVTTGNPAVPTWEIERDPRGGPLRVYEDQKDRERATARLVLPIEGF